MDKNCKHCGASFTANVMQRQVCDACREKNRRELQLRAQKRYEQSDKGKQTKHHYQSAEGKKRRLTPTQEQVRASSSARFARD